MATLTATAQIVPSNAPARPRALASTGPALSGKLRTILAPKPRVIPSPPSDASFQTRIPIRKKREHSEVALDENETSGDVRQAHIRQRCDSGSSVRTVLPRTRTNSQESVRTIKLKAETLAIPRASLSLKASPTVPAPPLVKSLSEPPRATLSRPDRASALANIARTASALRRTTYHNKAGDDEANTLSFPSDIASIPVARVRTGMDKTRLSVARDQSPPVAANKLGKSLKRTKSRRDLLVEKDYDHLDRLCKTSVSVEVYEAQVDAALSEIRRAKEAHRELLDDEDEEIVQKVVRDVVADPDVAAEAEALRRSPRGRIVMDDLEEIPDVFSDEEEDSRAWLGERAPSVPPFARWEAHERFDVIVKPMNKHSTMWDVDFEDTYAWQGLLVVTDAKPYTGIPPRLPMLDIDLEWRTIDTRARTLRSDSEPEYAAHYEGAALPGTQILAQMKPTRGIYTQPVWTFLQPDWPGAGAGGAWALRFWVPVPMHLFRGRDVRRFVVDARVVFGGGGCEDTAGVGHSERVDVTIEHLRRERDMKITAVKE
ncbi:uncharacterized protein C8Q71DRAFT_452339 [Rhodofomes roseus]|uniref:Uncharacterized protein n=1 Tax=Rhodofomes roseus TaxID=34475 RepID=A0ABQ8JXP1_9APHY|nr:uncharacterized protein C8Q71DRAFT_452339 [Rhodofomes roseus]KAH9828963.1 hypothetical protein C8Q71DRAFT_452339 [Rhodofomes roseus]